MLKLGVLVTRDSRLHRHVTVGGAPCVDFLTGKKQEASAGDRRGAKGQFYQALLLWQIMNVESVFGGLFTLHIADAALAARARGSRRTDDRTCTYASSRLVHK